MELFCFITLQFLTNHYRSRKGGSHIHIVNYYRIQKESPLPSSPRCLLSTHTGVRWCEGVRWGPLPLAAAVAACLGAHLLQRSYGAEADEGAQTPLQLLQPCSRRPRHLQMFNFVPSPIRVSQLLQRYGRIPNHNSSDVQIFAALFVIG